MVSGSLTTLWLMSKPGPDPAANAQAYTHDNLWKISMITFKRVERACSVIPEPPTNLRATIDQDEYVRISWETRYTSQNTFHVITIVLKKNNEIIQSQNTTSLHFPVRCDFYDFSSSDFIWWVNALDFMLLHQSDYNLSICLWLQIPHCIRSYACSG